MIIRALTIFLAVASGSVTAETLTAVRVIRADAILSPGDFTVIEVAVPGAIPVDTDLSGLQALTTLYPGRPIMASHVGPAAVVTRNQPVTLVYRRGGLFIETEARSLGRAAVGDVVRVMNLASRNTVTGQVRPDGSVEVSAERSSN